MNKNVEELKKSIKGDKNLPLPLQNLLIQEVNDSNIISKKFISIKAYQSEFVPIADKYYKPISKCFKLN